MLKSSHVLSSDADGKCCSEICFEHRGKTCADAGVTLTNYLKTDACDLSQLGTLTAQATCTDVKNASRQIVCICSPEVATDGGSWVPRVAGGGGVQEPCAAGTTRSAVEPDLVYDFTEHNDLASWTAKADSIGATYYLTNYNFGGVYATKMEIGYIQLALPSDYAVLEVVLGNSNSQGTVQLYIDDIEQVSASRKQTKTYSQSYTSGQILKIQEVDKAVLDGALIIKLCRIVCGTTSTCEGCAAGKYKEAAGDAACTDCPASSSSPEGSTAATDCTCNAGYTGPDGGACNACVAGKHKAQIGSGSCTNCASGTYSTKEAAMSSSVCTGCPADSSSSAGSDAGSDCTCNAGYTGLDGEACGTCEASKYKAAAGDAACSECAASSSSPEGSTASTNCTCNAGYTGPDGDTCEACPTGSSKVVRGSSACIPCAAGKYANETGHPEECLSCPAHTYSAEGSSLITNCTCNAGYTGPDGDACEACVSGKYKGIIGTSACFLCPVGKYSTGAGAASEEVCVACPNNTTSGEGSSNIANCTNTSTAAPTPPLTTPPP